MPSSQEEMLAGWDEVLAAVAANQADLSHVDDYRAQLAASAEALRILRARRFMLRNELQQKTLEVQAVLARGKDLLARIQAGVRSRYGIKSDKLNDFGIKPRGGRRPSKRRSVPDRQEDGASPEFRRTEVGSRP